MPDDHDDSDNVIQFKRPPRRAWRPEDVPDRLMRALFTDWDDDPPTPLPEDVDEDGGPTVL